MRLRGSGVFALVMTGLFAFVVGSAWTWQGSQRIFPLLMGIPGLLLSIVAVFRTLRQLSGSKEAQFRGLDLFENPADRQIHLARSAIIFGWIFGLGGLVWLTGFRIAIPIFVFTYVKFQGREGWLVAAGITLGVLVMVIGFFGLVLAYPWPQGAIQRWLGL